MKHTVTVLDAQEAHDPTIEIHTTPSEKPRNSTSPPSACTFGTTCQARASRRKAARRVSGITGPS